MKYLSYWGANKGNLQGISGNFDQVETQHNSEKEHCNREKSVEPQTTHVGWAIISEISCFSSTNGYNFCQSTEVINLLSNNEYLKTFKIQVAYYSECYSMVGLIWKISVFAVAPGICRQDFYFIFLHFLWFLCSFADMGWITFSSCWDLSVFIFTLFKILSDLLENRHTENMKTLRKYWKWFYKFWEKKTEIWILLYREAFQTETYEIVFNKFTFNFLESLPFENNIYPEAYIYIFVIFISPYTNFYWAIL